MIKLLILDVDGVMTDGIKYYDREGTVKLKTFCDRSSSTSSAAAAATARRRALATRLLFCE